MLAFIHRKMNFRIWKICGHFQIFGAAHRSAPAPSAREEAAKHAPNYMHVELCLERHQNDVQLWRAARVWRQHHETRQHLWVSNYRHYMLHIQDSKQARSAQCSLLGRSAGWKLERPGSPTCEEAPKLCLVLRTGWAACGTTSRRRPGAGTLAHGNRQHHNAEQGSIRAKKQQHECWWTWKQSSCPL